MIETWKKHFSLKQLTLEHDKSITFIVSQWQRESKPCVTYLIYRWIIALIFLITFILSIIDLKNLDAGEEYRAKWLVYLTNWGYTACTFQALLAAILLSISLINLNKQPRLTKVYKTYWAANIIATVVGFGITIIYWSLIYNGKALGFDAMNFLVHGNNSILLMLDLFIVSHPIYLLHCVYPVALGMSYTIFSIIYYAAGGTSRTGDVYIYKILNWSRPGVTTAICFAIFAFILVIHTAVWSLHKLRIWIYDQYFRKEDEETFGGNLEPSKMAYINEAMPNDNL